MRDLRYKGKPYRPTNRQADKLPDLCYCKFVAIGEPLNSDECNIHYGCIYSCAAKGCACTEYRPAKVKEYPLHWPICACGHIAQEH